MPVRQFTRQFWFPSGVLASNIPARVFPLNSNALAALWTDGTATTPLANPVTTDVNGNVSFWAEEGEYWIHIDAETFRFSVGSPDADLFEVSASAMDTGVISGGEISVNGSNPAAVDISAVTGYIVDEVTDPDVPAVTRIRRAAQTVALAGASLTRVITWWLMDSTGAVIQQGTRPTNTQRRTHLVLGVTAYDSGAGAIFQDQSLPTLPAQPMNQVADLMDALGPFVISGNVLTPNGANLSLNKTTGSVFARAFNHFSGPTLTRDPHVNTTAAQTPVTLRRLTQLAQFPAPAAVTTIDPTKWESAPGVLTTVTGNDATIQRVWLFPANSTADQVVVQYGQELYPDFATALDSLGQTGYVVNPTTDHNAALIAYIIVRGSATALNDTAQCLIKVAGRFQFP